MPPAERIREPIDVVFHNALSERAAAVSLDAWRCWSLLLGGAVLRWLLYQAGLAVRRRALEKCGAALQRDTDT